MDPFEYQSIPQGRGLAPVSLSPRRPGCPGRPDYDEPWPTRLAAESFISYGLFADIARNRSRARLSGTVPRAAHHVCGLTGQRFIAAEVRTAGFTADLCLAAGDHADMPMPGNVISGTVVLSASKSLDPDW